MSEVDCVEEVREAAEENAAALLEAVASVPTPAAAGRNSASFKHMSTKANKKHSLGGLYVNMVLPPAARDKSKLRGLSPTRGARELGKLLRDSDGGSPDEDKGKAATPLALIGIGSIGGTGYTEPPPQEVLRARERAERGRLNAERVRAGGHRGVAPGVVHAVTTRKRVSCKKTAPEFPVVPPPPPGPPSSEVIAKAVVPWEDANGRIHVPPPMVSHAEIKASIASERKEKRKCANNEAESKDLVEAEDAIVEVQPPASQPPLASNEEVEHPEPQPPLASNQSKRRRRS